MMKFAIVAISIVSMSFTANAKCKAALTEELELRSEAEGFELEGLSKVTKKQAQEMIKSARKDSSTEQERALALDLTNQANKEFFAVQWNAQSNFGTTLTIVDTTNCYIKAEIVHDSQE